MSEHVFKMKQPGIGRAGRPFSLRQPFLDGFGLATALNENQAHILILRQPNGRLPPFGVGERGIERH